QIQRHSPPPAAELDRSGGQRDYLPAEGGNVATTMGSLVNGAIRLESDGVSEEEVQAFVRLFDAVWTRLPIQHRECIESYWQSRVAPPSCRNKPHTKQQYDPHIH